MFQQFSERNRELLVNINGELVHRDKAGVSPFDSAVQNGDAVWEGVRLYDDRIFKLHEHLARLRRSAEALAFPEIPPDERIIDEIKRTLAANKIRDGVHIRLTLTRGFVAETNAAHVFLVRKGEVATSRVVACPEGITRETVLEICEATGIPHAESDLTLDDVYRADEMFCTGTMGELAGVIKVDGRIIGAGEVGPLTRRLSGLFAERTAREGTEIA